MPFDNSQFDVGFAPAITPSPLSAPLRPGIETDAVLDVLTKAREWLSDPAHWCKGAGRLDRDGLKIGRSDIETAIAQIPLVAQTCAHGAVGIACRYDRIIAWEIDGTLRAALPRGWSDYGVPAFNDDPTTTHADVLSLFDRAIEARKAGA